MKSKCQSPIKMSRGTIGWILALIGAISIGLAFVFTDYFLWWFVPGILPYLAFAYGFFTQCPSCGRWWASEDTGSVLLDRWTETKDIDREDVTKDRMGNELFRTKRTEQVTMTCERRQHHYKCRYCNASWTKIKDHRDR